MLIRISGGIQGIKQYLENGQKQGRDFSRNELDERIILAGDLEAADAIIQRMGGNGEKYLHITIAFKEDEIDRDTLTSIAREFESFAFAAYDKDEYSFYAEAHLPRVKSYTNEKTGEFVERKPHIHVVVPKTNLLSGKHLNPFGVVEQNERFIDAFQELVNHKYGLASPKENRRIEFTGESEMISRYKGDIFGGQSKDLKGSILDAMLTREVENYDDFKAMLSEFGETRARNEGKAAEYQNIKAADSSKGVNLKEYVFTREFVELPATEKRKRLAAEVRHKYETTGPPRKTPQELDATLDEWHQVRAKEVKYLNSGSRKAYQEYRDADQDGRRRLLADREARFYAKHRQEQTHEQEQHNDNRKGRHYAGKFERRYGLKQSQERSAGTDGRGGSPSHRKLRFSATAKGTSARSLDSVPNLSSVGVDGHGQRGEVLLPGDAAHHVEHIRQERTNPLRRPDDQQRDLNATARKADNATSQFAHDQQERKQARASESQSEFQEIKAKLDARRLLADLSQSHGVIPDKYEVTKGKDGSDRIKSGTRNLNVSDFLTKELNLGWADAAQIMRATYARQLEKEPEQAARREPQRQLWSEFQQDRKTKGPRLHAAQWTEQRTKERDRWDAIKKAFYVQRAKAQSDRSLRPAERKAAVSIARMERLASEAVLRERVVIERDKLKAEQKKPIREHYRDFLAEMAQAGDEQALAELRRMRPEPIDKDQATDIEVRPAERQDEEGRAPICRAPALTYQVARNGDVTYQRGGRDVLCDAGQKVQVLQQDTETIETALRLAQQKFGSKLTLTGPQDFQEKAARIAAEAGLKVEFTDPRMNQVMQDRRAEIDAEKARQGDARKLAQAFAKQREQEKAQQQQPAQAVESTQTDAMRNLDGDKASVSALLQQLAAQGVLKPVRLVEPEDWARHKGRIIATNGRHAAIEERDAVTIHAVEHMRVTSDGTLQGQDAVAPGNDAVLLYRKDRAGQVQAKTAITEQRKEHQPTRSRPLER